MDTYKRSVDATVLIRPFDPIEAQFYLYRAMPELVTRLKRLEDARCKIYPSGIVEKTNGYIKSTNIKTYNNS